MSVHVLRKRWRDLKGKNGGEEKKKSHILRLYVRNLIIPSILQAQIFNSGSQ